MISKLVMVPLFLIFVSAFGQTTAIPDANFEQALIDLGYDSGPIDGVVTTANINSVQILNVNNKGIADLTGIEDFTSLINLECSYNSLTSLDMSGNPNLSSLTCSANSIDSLNITNNPDLVYLECNFNQLAHLDVSQCVLLQSLFMAANQINVIDISSNVNLLSFICDQNNLTFLDLSQNTQLYHLNCVVNNLSSLDVSNNPDLQYLYCSRNMLNSLDVSTNFELIDLFCKDNNLSELSVEYNSELHNLACDTNQLQCLNVQNGVNQSMFLMSATNNPFLSCIEVDDAAYASTNWFDVDPGVSFSLNCTNSCVTAFPEENASKFNLFPNPAIDYMKLENIPPNSEKFIIYDPSGRVIYSVNNIQDEVKLIDIRLLANGVYFYSLQDSKGVLETGKLMVTNKSN